MLLAGGGLRAAAAADQPAASGEELPARLLVAPRRNPLPNPGFEQWSKDQPRGWLSDDVRPAQENRPASEGAFSGLLRVPANESMASLYTAAVVPVENGGGYRLSVWARGRGALRLGYSSLYRLPGEERRFERVMQPDAVTLSDDWQEAVFLFVPTHPVKIWLQVEGADAEAYMDDVQLVQVHEPKTRLEITPAHPMVAAGEDAVPDIRLLAGARELTAGTLALALEDPEGNGTRFELPLEAEPGVGHRLPGRLIPRPGLYRARAVHAETDTSQGFTIDVMEREAYAAFEAKGRAAGLAPLPAHILILGDSLTDFDRGQNWVDKAAGWLRVKYGSQVSVKNGAVGGDFISRIWQRLHTPSGGFKAERYDGLLDILPTHIFIFVGHNDSKVTSDSGYTEPVVSLADFEQDYRNVIAYLRQATGARIIIMSSVSCDYAVTKASADRARAADRSHNLFGVPEVLEQFNAVARKVAADTGCAFLDVYTPTREHPDKATLFDQSGVHLANEGHRVLAREVLLFLAAADGDMSHQAEAEQQGSCKTSRGMGILPM
ncbi:MAG: hypothetical protein K9N49_08785 [Candidatus Marinimicrobia bacterium]|nr:hypothetical protein [Candidatus Neomarinimicrobiota bacterium]